MCRMELIPFSDGFAFNFEERQFTQARTAYSLPESTSIKLFLSLDINVLPSTTVQEAGRTAREDFASAQPR